MAGKTMIPLLAFAAWSGTGKTTLLKKLIPALCARGIRPGLIKHTHHDMGEGTEGRDVRVLPDARVERVRVYQ